MRLHGELPRFQFGEGEEVADQVGEPVRVVLDDAEKAVPAPRVVGQVAGEERLRVSLYHGDRGSQLVGDVGHEVAADLVRLFHGAYVVEYRHHAAQFHPLQERHPVHQGGLPAGKGQLPALLLPFGEHLTARGVEVRVSRDLEKLFPLHIRRGAEHGAEGRIDQGDDRSLVGDHHPFAHSLQDGVQPVPFRGDPVQLLLYPRRHVVHHLGELAQFVGALHRDPRAVLAVPDAGRAGGEGSQVARVDVGEDIGEKKRGDHRDGQRGCQGALQPLFCLLQPGEGEGEADDRA